jgi:hypothetical protein
MPSAGVYGEQNLSREVVSRGSSRSTMVAVFKTIVERGTAWLQAYVGSSSLPAAPRVGWVTFGACVQVRDFVQLI